MHREKGIVKLKHKMNCLTTLNLLALASSTGGAPALALFAMDTEEDSGIVDKPGLPC